MKRYINVIGLLCCLLFWNSCTDEEYANKRVEEGIPMDVKILFTSPEMQQVKTKADMGVATENAVKDLYVFVFKSSGKLEHSYSFTEDQLIQSREISNAGVIALPLPGLTSGEKKIVAIANLTSSDINYKLENIQNLSTLKKEMVSLKDKLLQRPGGLFVMSGYYGTNVEVSLSEEGACLLDPKAANNGVVTLGGKIWLRHLDSKIKFNVKVSGPNKEFIPKDWQVVNVPMKSYLLPVEKDAAQTLSSDFFTQEQANRFEEMELTAQNQYVGGSFVFYMNENRKEALNWPKNENDYNLREFKTDKGGGTEVPFKYADSRSTYVVLRGSFYEYDTSGKLQLSADVRYTIHLGYGNQVASDFNSERNKSYTYNVTIENVDNIILEVESSQEGYEDGFKEEQPGAEGDVIVSDQNLLLDAHYEVKQITFYKDKLDNLSVMVRTPYESASSTTGMYKIDRKTGEITDCLSDYKWVELSKTKTGSGYKSYTEAKTSGTIQDIKEVLLDLKDKKEKEDNVFWDKDEKDNDLVTYTVFVDEYYYENNPLNGKKTSWKEFVNAENRQMHILCDTKYSIDDQSSLTKSNIMINQRSVKSIYNIESSELESAWGIETLEETQAIASKRIADKIVTSDTKTNGRYNVFQFFESNDYSIAWDDYVKASNNTFAPSEASRKYAEYVCLHRNRDLDGDGKIDDDEVRWYLPATNQYIGLWIGQDALSAEARLLQANISKVDKDNRFNYHLISSNGVRFWTEEGVSTASNDLGKNEFHVRCARNLGMVDNRRPTNIADEPADYAIVKKDGNKHVTSVDLSRVSPLALRSVQYSSIGFHTEHGGGDLNQPYKSGFVVYESNTKGTFLFNKQQLTGSLSNCTDKTYRVPNQRELALIAGYSDTSFGQVLASCTYSALTYKSDLYTLLYNVSGFNYLTLSGAETSYARCVKDGLSR